MEKDDIFGKGKSPTGLDDGMEMLKEALDKKDSFSDDCFEFVNNVYKTMSEETDTCLLKSKVKKFVGCVSSAYRSQPDGCDSYLMRTGSKKGETMEDVCTWKGSMNKAWDMARMLRCE